MVIFDHMERLLMLTALAKDEADRGAKFMVSRVRAAPLELFHNKIGLLDIREPDRARSLGAVGAVKKHILAGDIFQGGALRSVHQDHRGRPPGRYRWRRVKSPSPYIFFVNYGPWQLVGTLPEILVKAEDGRVGIRPIAGTRGRGANHGRDLDLEREMLGLEKG
jgi:anthranilate synthase component 1